MRKNALRRIHFLSIFTIVGILVLAGRLYQVQVMKSDTYQAKAEAQYVHTKQDLYSRGSIFFTTKDGEKVSAASIQAGYMLALDPSRIDDAEALYQALAPHIEIDHDAFVNSATLENRTYVEIANVVNESAKDAIEALNLEGVMLYRDQWRQYPLGDVSARTVGFIGYTNKSNTLLHGKYGLERYYDEILVRDDEAVTVNFFAEVFSNLGTMVFDSGEQTQGSIVTSIEPRVSAILDAELEKIQSSYESKLTGGIIINPQTGAIYALHAVPTFNLNDRSGVSIESFNNPLVESVYEMGSIIKALTMAAGLDSGAVTADSTYYDAGSLELNTFTIRNYDGRARGTVSMQEVLNQSLNTGVSEVVQRMGKDRFREYFKNLKLASETGIDLPYEVHGLMDNLESPRDVEYATASFGQGVAFTPIATVRALAALGNGGKLVTPHIATAIEYDDGHVKEIVYPEGKQVFTPETSEEISRMLTVVVDDALRGGDVALPDYSIAAKTGTAQIADQENGGYYDDRYLHSFFGYFPSYDPQFLIFLYTVEPKGVRYASETLTDPFMSLSKFLINYYNVPPDR